jgi:hypothetical protein
MVAPEKDSKRKSKGAKAKPKKRIHNYTNEQISKLTPDMTDCWYIAEMWRECGECLSSGMGPVPLTWQEIEAYAQSECITPHEKRMIMLMSRAYVNGLNTKKGNEPPTLIILPEKQRDEFFRIQNRRQSQMLGNRKKGR